jgi:hypothetical protein
MVALGPFKLSGGYVSDTDIWNQPPGRVCVAESFEPWGDGVISQDALSLFATATNGASTQGFFYWMDPAQLGTANRDILILMATKAYTSPFNSISLTDRTNAVVLPATGFYTFDVLNGKAILANSGYPTTSLSPFKFTAYNGNIAALGGNPPVANLVKVVNGFCFLSQNLTSSTVSSRVYWSNVADPETWGAANFIDVSPLDGDIITGLSSVGTDLLIFKQRSIWRLATTTVTLSGSVTLAPLSLVSKNMGCCLGVNATDMMPDGTTVFIGPDDHVYQTDGTTVSDLSHQPTPASNIIMTMIRGNGRTQGTNAFLKVDSQNNRILVVYQQTTTGAFVFIYDYHRQAWFNWADMVGTTGTTLQYAQIMPGGTGLFGPTNRQLYCADDSGRVFSILNVFQGGLMGTNQILPQLEWSFVLGSDAPPNFIPRSMVIPLVLLTSNVSTAKGTINIYFGFDGIYQTTAAFTSNLSALPVQYTQASSQSDILDQISTAVGRINVPISIPQTQSKFPISLQMKIQIAGVSGLTPIAIEPFYLLDEVGR